MSVIYEDEYGKDWPFSPEELAGKVIEASLDHENCPYEAQVNVLLTGNEEIHEMNRNFRGIDRPTDVLSFPLLNYETPSDFSRVEEEEADSLDPESGELMLGISFSQGTRSWSRQRLMVTRRNGNLPFWWLTVCSTSVGTTI